MAYLTKVGEIYYIRKKIKGKIVHSKSTETSVYKEANDQLEEFRKDEKEAMKRFVPILCSAFAVEYLDLIKKRSKSKSENTYDTVKYCFSNFIKNCKDKFIHDYTVKEIDKFLLSKSPQTARKYKRTISAAFERAIKWKHIKENLWLETVELENSESEIKNVSKETFWKILEAAPNEVFRDVVFWATLSGMPRAELRKLKPQEINIESETIRVLSTNIDPTKSKATRFIELHSELIPVL